jgi:NADPH:quinone reductase-like Zn-dependent oxidoreductase
MLKHIAQWTAGIFLVVLLLGGAALLAGYMVSDNACRDPRTFAPSRPTMKAVIYCDYGSPDVLRTENVEKPVPDSNQVLVKVRVAALNPLDWHFVRGTPYVGRVGMGLRRPSNIQLGVDFAGVVESVGRGVSKFKPGDEVFGGRTGALAEYVLVSQDRAIVQKPANLSFDQAAAVPVAAVTALQGLRDQGKIRNGQRVLINGASGGVGTFAVQIAKAYGAHVTGVCSTRNVDLVRSLGADQVIDYTKDDFLSRGERYDLILDNVGNHSLLDLRQVLSPSGTYVMIGGPSGRWLDPMPRALGAVVISPFVKQEMKFFISSLNQADLAVLRDLLQTGEVTPVIDRRYNFGEVREAVRYLEEGHARAKVVVMMH